MAQNLQIIKNGEDISGKGIRSSEQILKEQLPELTMQLLSNIVILGQGLPNRVSSNTASGRKEVLEKLFKADFMIEDIKNRISSRLSNLKNEQRIAEDSILELSTKLKLIKETLNTLNNELVLLNNENIDKKYLDDLGISINELKEEIEYNKDKNIQINNINNSTNALIFALSEEKVKINNSDYLIEDIEKLKEEGTLLKSEIIALDKDIQNKDNITDICPTCGQKLIGVEKPDTTKDKNLSMSMKSKLNSLKDKVLELQQKRQEKIDSQVLEIDNKISDLKNQLQDIIDYSFIELELNKKTNEYSKLNEQLQTKEVKIKELKNNINQIEKQITELENKLSIEEENKIKIDSKLDINNKINTLIKRDFRGYLLSNIISVFDNTCKEYCQYVFNHKNLSILQENNNISIIFNNKYYEALSGGEKQKIDLILQLGLRQVLCDYIGFTTNIFILDEIFDNLDDISSEKVIELITNVINIQNIYIITHHASVPIPVDNYIIVKKNKKGSIATQF